MTDPTEANTLCWVALSLLAEPGDRTMGALVDEHGPDEALARLRAGDVPDDLREITAPRLALGDPYAAAADAMTQVERAGGRVVTPDCAEWPVRLGDLRLISHGRGVDWDVWPPLCLWVRGKHRLDTAIDRSVAVVGARAASPYGDKVALDLAYALAERSWTVVSGGAFGIDAQAHRGALGAGGITVAVLACGIDRAYPVAHANLFERIAEQGLVVSEWPPGYRPHRVRFLIRNRVIAALGRGTVVVEASARSGAKQTANRTAQLGRRLMAVPGPITSATSVGTHQLLRQEGSRLVTTAAEVIEEVGLIGDDLAPVVRGVAHRLDALDPQVAQVLDGVPSRGAAGPSEIAAAAGVPLRIALQALPVLHQQELVVLDADGRYTIAADVRRGTRTQAGGTR